MQARSTPAHPMQGRPPGEPLWSLSDQTIQAVVHPPLAAGFVSASTHTEATSARLMPLSGPFMPLSPWPALVHAGAGAFVGVMPGVRVLRSGGGGGGDGGGSTSGGY